MFPNSFKGMGTLQSDKNENTDTKLDRDISVCVCDKNHFKGRIIIGQSA